MDAMNNLNNQNTPQPENKGVVDYFAMLENEKMSIEKLFDNALDVAKQNHFSDSRMENLIKTQDTSIEGIIRLAHTVLRNILLSHGSNPKKLFLFFENKQYQKDYKALLNTVIELKQAMEFDPESVVNEKAMAVRHLANAMNQKYEIDREKQNMLDALSEYIADTIKNAVKVQKITNRYKNYDEDMKLLIEMKKYLSELIGDAYSQNAVSYCQAVATKLMNYRENFEQGIVSTIHLEDAMGIIVDSWSKSRKLTGKRNNIEVNLNPQDTLSRATRFGRVKQMVETFFEGVSRVEDDFVRDKDRAIDLYNQKISEYVELKKRFWDTDNSYKNKEISEDEYNQMVASMKQDAMRLSNEIKAAEADMKVAIVDFEQINEIFKLMHTIMATEKALAEKYRLASLVDAFEEDEEINYAAILHALSGDQFDERVSPDVVVRILRKYIDKQMSKIERVVGIGEKAAEISKEIEKEKAKKAQKYDEQKSNVFENPLKGVKQDVSDLKNFFGPQSAQVNPKTMDIEELFGENPNKIRFNGNPNPADSDN